MTALITLMVPFFGALLVGYGGGYFRWIGTEALAGLEFFVVKVALPALFFQLIVATPPGAYSGWSFVATTTFATYCAFAIAFSVGALVNGGNVPEATVQGLVGSWSNTGSLAPALVIGALGATAAAPMALIYSADAVLLMAVTPMMMALGATERTDLAKLGEGVARSIVLHPPIVATVLGFIALAFGLRLPEPVEGLFSLVGSAAAPTALFAFGVSLAHRVPKPLTLELPLLLAVKLIAHPLIVYLLLTWVGGFDTAWVHVAVLIAALPPAAGVIGMAEHYRIYVPQVSAATLVGAAAAVVTVTVTVAWILLDSVP